MYQLACWLPEEENLALMFPLNAGLRMSFHIFGIWSPLTRSLLYAMPANVAPAQVKYPAGLLWYSGL